MQYLENQLQYLKRFQQHPFPMAMSKSKIAIGLSVVGLLAIIFGTVLVFVGPVVIHDQIIKVSWLYKVEMDLRTRNNQFMTVATYSLLSVNEIWTMKSKLTRITDLILQKQFNRPVQFGRVTVITSKSNNKLENNLQNSNLLNMFVCFLIYHLYCSVMCFTECRNQPQK